MVMRLGKKKEKKKKKIQGNLDLTNIYKSSE